MTVRIKTPDDFDRMLKALASDVVDAAIHLRLYKNLREAVPEYVRELNQSPAFWNLTFAAHFDAVLARLARAYDQHSSSLSLLTLVDSVSQAPRSPGTPTVSIDSAELRRDRQSVSPKDPLVKRLVSLRGNIFAHRNAANVIDSLGLEVRFGFSMQELDELSDRAVAILNRYGQILRRNTWSTKMVGHDDYLGVLKSVRAAVLAYEQSIEQQIAEMTKPRAT